MPLLGLLCLSLGRHLDEGQPVAPKVDADSQALGLALRLLLLVLVAGTIEAALEGTGGLFDDHALAVIADGNLKRPENIEQDHQCNSAL